MDPSSLTTGGRGVTIHIRSYPYCELSSCIPVTPLTVAAFGIIAVELPAYALSRDIVSLKRVVFPVPVTILSFVVVSRRGDRRSEDRPEGTPRV